MQKNVHFYKNHPYRTYLVPHQPPGDRGRRGAATAPLPLAASDAPWDRAGLLRRFRPRHSARSLTPTSSTTLTALGRFPIGLRSFHRRRGASTACGSWSAQSDASGSRGPLSGLGRVGPQHRAGPWGSGPAGGYGGGWRGPMGRSRGLLNGAFQAVCRGQVFALLRLQICNISRRGMPEGGATLKGFPWVFFAVQGLVRRLRQHRKSISYRKRGFGTIY